MAFLGLAAFALLGASVPAQEAKPTLFLIGDSTVRNGRGDGANGQWGWGEPISAYFDTTRLDVVNRALGGRSSRTYLTGGQWDAVRAELKAGDFVVMQFGHNDGGAINDLSRARGLNSTCLSTRSSHRRAPAGFLRDQRSDR